MTVSKYRSTGLIDVAQFRRVCLQMLVTSNPASSAPSVARCLLYGRTVAVNDFPTELRETSRTVPLSATARATAWCTSSTVTLRPGGDREDQDVPVIVDAKGFA